MIRRYLRYWLSLVARWIASHPKLKQVILGIIDTLPDAFEARLRRVIAPRNQGNFLQLGQGIAFQSPMETRLLKTLTQIGKSNRQPALDKPSLAYFSPLPPERTGISNYSLMLLPWLSHHYCVTVVVNQEQVASGPELDGITVISFDEFQLRGDEFDRILYHFGNAPFHAHMFDALARWPGVVMLHDFFLGHVVGYLNNLSPGYLDKSLYDGWGYTALLDGRDKVQREEIIWQYPLNADVLADALGLIVHSGFSMTLARAYYGDALHQQWHIIPHLKAPAEKLDRAEVRARLGLPEDAFVVCSFGHITPTKRHLDILDAWQRSSLSQDQNCWLVFVGELASGRHGEEIKRQLHSMGKSRVRVTGWADNATFDAYLGAADAAIQLRSKSRGETSGAVIDCMNHGLATIVNSHGTMADLPADSVMMLPDRFEIDDLVLSLEKVYTDSAFRLALGERALSTIHRDHDPSHCAHAYAEAIESCYQYRSQYLTSLNGVQESRNSSEQLAALTAQILASPLARQLAPLRQPQLLVDLSAMVHTDLRTGIERVVRAQLLELIKSPPPGYRVEPVYLHRGDTGWNYHYARAYGWSLLNLGATPLADEKVDFTCDDILYMPDLNAHATVHAHQAGLFDTIREKGTRINVLIHDLLPVTLPDSFPPGAGDNHQRWLEAISGFADHIICISRSVADEYRDWREHNALDNRDIPISVNYHGADIDASSPTTGIPRPGRKILKQLGQRPSFLAVGTAEPRKGYLEVLDAFDVLWQQGRDINLVIVGKEGWKDLPEEQRRTIPQLVKRLDWHPERNKRLFWLQSISDEYLAALYSASACLVAASFDEGFGLPLIEAARQGVPVIARDIPVFREVAGDSAHFFQPEQVPMASAIGQWLDSRKTEEAIALPALAARSWQQNVADLKALLTGPGD